MAGSCHTTAALTQRYAYDKAGNTITRPGDTAEQHLTWNAEGRLQELDEGGRKTTFVYDAEGNRLLRKQPGTNTLYLPNTDLKLDTATGVVTATRMYDLGAGAVAIRTKAGVTFTIGDHHGTAAVAVDVTTGAATRRRSTPFGGVRGVQPAPGVWPGERGFVGGAVDELEGLTHLGAREYDPAIGRFISADPVIDYTQPQQIHGYTYANNNPVTLSDPTGEDPWTDGFVSDVTQTAMKAYYDTSRKIQGSVTDHDMAIRVRVANLRRNYPNAHLKFDYKNMKHGADIICYDCSPGAVWVWEVKPSDGQSAALKDAEKHAGKLTETIGYRARGKGVRVMRGPTIAFVPNEEYALGSNGHDEVMKIWSPVDGVVLYEVRKGDKEAPAAAFKLQRETNRIASQEQTKYEKENYEIHTYGSLDSGAVKSDPMADALIIAPIAIGVAACVVYCFGGAAAAGAAAGARWLWRAVRPERAPTLRKGDHDLAG